MFMLATLIATAATLAPTEPVILEGNAGEELIVIENLDEKAKKEKQEIVIDETLEDFDSDFEEEEG